MRRLLILACTAFAAAGIATPASAATASPSPSPSPTPLRVIRKVTITGASASRQEQFQSPFSGSLINRKQIKELGPNQSMQTILSSKPSVEVFGFGGSPYVRSHLSFRGFNGGEFGETLDGIPLNGLFNGGVTNSASQRNATPFVTSLLSSVNIYRGVNDPQHTSIDSLGGSVAYHLVDPTNKPHLSLTYNLGEGGDIFAQTGKTAIFGTRFAIGVGSDYYRGFQPGVPDANRYLYINGIVPLKGPNFLRLIYSVDRNVGYVPHDVPIGPYNGLSLQEDGVDFQWPTDLTYSYNTADVNLAILDFAHGWSPRLTSRFTMFRYDTGYHRMSYANPNDGFLPNAPFAPTFAQPYMNGVISSNPADFQFHLYRNSDQRLGFVWRNAWTTSATNSIIFGIQYEHGYEISQEYWGPTLNFAPLDTYNDAWNQPGYRNSSVTYIEDKYHLGKLLINPGIRWNGVQTADYTPVVGYFYSFPFAVGNSYNFTEPSLGLRYAFSPTLVGYAGFGSSAKPPEIAAYYSDNQLIPGTSQIAPLVVQPEYSLDFDTGLRGQTHGMSWSADVYNDRFTNTFSTAPAGLGYYEGLGLSPGAAQNAVANGAIILTTNAGNAVYRGYELSLSHIPLTRSASLLGFANFAENVAVYTSAFPYGSSTPANPLYAQPGTTVPYVPSQTANIGIYHRGKRLDWRLGAHGIGQQLMFDDVLGGPSPTQFLSGFTTVNGYLAYKLDRAGRDTLSLAGSNLLNKRALVYGYVSSSFANPLTVAMPLPPRSWYLSITRDMP